MSKSLGAVAPIRTVGLAKTFHSSGRGTAPVVAVDHVDLEVERGEFFGLLGPNGAGKSTTIGMLTTRVRPGEGQAFIGGIDVVADPSSAKRLIGVVPQTNTLDRQLSVFENLEFHGRYFGVPRREAKVRAAELLEQFQLADRAGSDIYSLSGGMAQRLMVARALVHRPEVLFLDEPTSGIDPQTRLTLWDLLRSLHTQGQTILLTTHYMEEADALCDRVAIIDHGRILADGTPEDLKRSLGAETVITLRTTGGDLRRFRAAAKKIPAVASVEEDGELTRVYATQSEGLLAHLVGQAGALNVSISDATSQPPTLEAVFLAKTGRDLRE